MPIPHQEPEFRSHFLRRFNNVALIVYTLRKSINCSLSARLSPRQAFASLMPAHSSFAVDESPYFRAFYGGRTRDRTLDLSRVKGRVKGQKTENTVTY
jgi:hypothetical protein